MQNEIEIPCAKDTCEHDCKHCTWSEEIDDVVTRYECVCEEYCANGETDEYGNSYCKLLAPF